MALRLTYDASADMAYLEFRRTGPDDVIGPALFLEPDRAFPGHVTADFGLEDGVLIGLEFSFASRCLPADLLATAERIDGTHAHRRSAERIGRLPVAGPRKSKGVAGEVTH